MSYTKKSIMISNDSNYGTIAKNLFTTVFENTTTISNVTVKSAIQKQSNMFYKL